MRMPTKQRRIINTPQTTPTSRLVLHRISPLSLAKNTNAGLNAGTTACITAGQGRPARAVVAGSGEARWCSFSTPAGCRSPTSACGTAAFRARVLMFMAAVGISCSPTEASCLAPAACSVERIVASGAALSLEALLVLCTRKDSCMRLWLWLLRYSSISPELSPGYFADGCLLIWFTNATECNSLAMNAAGPAASNTTAKGTAI
mmetsp:Transcript_968/g.3219  ORF Transcript_968/g.3219 Transcript_968/m.3219 type:complete len:204 (-) Transcript_968:111-722(-)